MFICRFSSFSRGGEIAHFRGHGKYEDWHSCRSGQISNGQEFPYEQNTA